MSDKRVNGITFDGLHTYYDLGLYLAKRPDLGAPEPKIYAIEIPGTDGTLDLTEASSNGVKYGNRIMIFSLSAMVEADKHQAFKSQVMNALHGRNFSEIVLDEDPDWYYTGRATVQWIESKPWKIRCVVTVDAYPYALKASLTERVVVDIPSAPVTRSMEIARNDPLDAFNSVFHLGNKSEPHGLSMYDPITIKWPADARYYNNRIIRVWDADGNIQDFDISSVSMNNRQYVINASDFTAVNRAQIYQIKVAGIGGCELWGDQPTGQSPSFTLQVWNERRNAIPEWGITGTAPVQIIVNGKLILVQSGWSTNENVWLTEGWNNVTVIYGTGDSAPMRFAMRYQEGKL